MSTPHQRNQKALKRALGETHLEQTEDHNLRKLRACGNVKLASYSISVLDTRGCLSKKIITLENEAATIVVAQLLVSLTSIKTVTFSTEFCDYYGGLSALRCSRAE